MADQWFFVDEGTLALSVSHLENLQMVDDRGYANFQNITAFELE